jgi:hypothetical protein
VWEDLGREKLRPRVFRLIGLMSKSESKDDIWGVDGMGCTVASRLLWAMVFLDEREVGVNARSSWPRARSD